MRNDLRRESFERIRGLFDQKREALRLSNHAVLSRKSRRFSNDAHHFHKSTATHFGQALVGLLTKNKGMLCLHSLVLFLILDNELIVNNNRPADIFLAFFHLSIKTP